VQEEVIERVAEAGGELLAIDFGRISDETTASWMTNRFHGLMAEGYRRQISEKVKAAHATAIEQGRHVARLPIGYLRQGRLHRPGRGDRADDPQGLRDEGGRRDGQRSSGR
jgi:DNA invertase Pin-like site-specific DNA recombinase